MVNGWEKRRESGGKECESDSVVYIGFEKGTISPKLYKTPKVLELRLLVPRGPKIPKQMAHHFQCSHIKSLNLPLNNLWPLFVTFFFQEAWIISSTPMSWRNKQTMDSTTQKWFLQENIRLEYYFYYVILPRVRDFGLFILNLRLWSFNY